MGARAVGPWVGEQKPLGKSPLRGNPSPESTYLPTSVLLHRGTAWLGEEGKKNCGCTPWLKAAAIDVVNAQGEATKPVLLCNT